MYKLLAKIGTNQEDHLKDLRIVLNQLRRKQLKMVPLKCTFTDISRKFLGFVVCHRDIEIYQSKHAIQNMP